MHVEVVSSCGSSVLADCVDTGATSTTGRASSTAGTYLFGVRASEALFKASDREAAEADRHLLGKLETLQHGSPHLYGHVQVPKLDQKPSVQQASSSAAPEWDGPLLYSHRRLPVFSCDFLR